MRTVQPEPRYLAIGRVTRPHGVRGELRVEIITDYPERIASVGTLYVGRERRAHQLLGARVHGQVLLVALEGYGDRTAAEALRGEVLYIATGDAVPLDPDEYYEHQVEGMVVLTETGDALGRVVEVFTAPGANDVFVVHGPLGEILIPAVDEMVIEVDTEARRVVIRPLPGLLPDRS